MRITTRNADIVSARSNDSWGRSNDEGGDWNYNPDMEVHGGSLIQQSKIDTIDESEG